MQREVRLAHAGKGEEILYGPLATAEKVKDSQSDGAGEGFADSGMKLVDLVSHGLGEIQFGYLNIHESFVCTPGALLFVQYVRNPQEEPSRDPAEEGRMEAKQSNVWPWSALTILLGVGALVLLAAFVAPSGGYAMMGVGWGWGIGMMAIPLVALVLIVLVIAGASTPHGAPVGNVTPASLPPPISSAEEILNARYARGEISRDEYTRIRQDLQGRSS